MTQHNALSPTLLVGFDFTDHSTRALDQALRFAGTWPGTRLIVLWAGGAKLERRLDEPKESAEDRALFRVKEYVEERVQRMEQAGYPPAALQAEVLLSGLEPEKALTENAFFEGADMILVGTGEKDTLDRLILGSVSQAVLRNAPCSVFIVRDKKGQPQFAAPRADRSEGTLGRRHTYSYQSRNAQPGVTFPLFFPMT